MPVTVHHEHEFLLAGITPEQAWELVADTDEMNKLIGLPPMEAKVLDATFGATKSSVRMRGFPNLVWEEEPFEFVRPEKYRVVRRYIGGPLESFVGGADLFADPKGTRIRLVGDAVVRFAWLTPIVRLGAYRALRISERKLREALRPATASSTVMFFAPPTPPAFGAAERIAAKMPGLLAVSPAWARKLAEFLREGPDIDVLRLRPFDLADRWNAPRLDILRLCLHATKAELLNMSWDILCPHCRLPALRGRALKDVSNEAVCGACDFDIQIEFDTAVEVSFKVHPSIRPLDGAAFCLGSPAKRRGILFQQVLNAGEVREITLPLKAGEYVLQRADAEKHLAVQVGAGSDRVQARITAGGVDSGGLANVVAGEGKVTFSMRNELPGRVRIGFGYAVQSADAASAALVTSLQDFRDLFSSEVLAPGIQIGVSSVTLLFTDLKGSTKMYEEHKDPRAFSRVRQHFDVLIAAVSAEGGGVVKTIGDAVMATFPTPASGVRAALAMQRRIEALNRTWTDPPFLTVKIGLHAGPCLAITANERLDYFGNSVNTAARIEGQSLGGDVVITETMAADAEVKEILADAGLRVTAFESQLKGLAGLQRLLRLELLAMDAARGHG